MTIVETDEGRLWVRTVRRPFFFLKPFTGILLDRTEASSFRSALLKLDQNTARSVLFKFYWNTADRAVLKELHAGIIAWIELIGFSCALEFCITAQSMESTMRSFAVETPQYRDIALDKEGALLRQLLAERPVPGIYKGVALPLEIVKYIKAIMYL